jgi:type I restriction enzyme S subunit
VRNEYLYYWTQSLDLRDISNGGVIPQLNRKDLAPLEVPVPTLEKQEIIINELEQAEVSCSELRVTFEEADQECISLRDAILHKAFAGEL